MNAIRKKLTGSDILEKVEEAEMAMRKRNAVLDEDDKGEGEDKGEDGGEPSEKIVRRQDVSFEIMVQDPKTDTYLLAHIAFLFCVPKIPYALLKIEDKDLIDKMEACRYTAKGVFIPQSSGLPVLRPVDIKHTKTGMKVKYIQASENLMVIDYSHSESKAIFNYDFLLDIYPEQDHGMADLKELKNYTFTGKVYNVHVDSKLKVTLTSEKRDDEEDESEDYNPFTKGTEKYKQVGTITADYTLQFGVYGTFQIKKQDVPCIRQYTRDLKVFPNPGYIFMREKLHLRGLVNRRGPDRKPELLNIASKKNTIGQACVAVCRNLIGRVSMTEKVSFFELSAYYTDCFFLPEEFKIHYLFT